MASSSKSSTQRSRKKRSRAQDYDNFIIPDTDAAPSTSFLEESAVLDLSTGILHTSYTVVDADIVPSPSKRRHIDADTTPDPSLAMSLDYYTAQIKSPGLASEPEASAEETPANLKETVKKKRARYQAGSRVTAGQSVKLQPFKDHLTELQLYRRSSAIASVKWNEAKARAPIALEDAKEKARKEASKAEREEAERVEREEKAEKAAYEKEAHEKAEKAKHGKTTGKATRTLAKKGGK